MKAIILAGGSGDRLWPLSRKNFPKQFLKLVGDNSLLQETVIRNIPFCEEFLIVAGKEYEYIIGEQLSQFQGISYRLVIEESATGTLAAAELALADIDDEELVFIMSSDLMLGTDGYSDAIYRAKELAEARRLVLFGAQATEAATAYGYISHDGETVTGFVEKPSRQIAEQLLAEGDVLWNSGMILCQKCTFEKATKKPERNIERAILESATNLSVIELADAWHDASNFHAYEKTVTLDDSKPVITRNCHDTTVINDSTRQLVVANGVSDLYIVSTDDAIYITDKAAEQDIKGIIRDSSEDIADYFNTGVKAYRPWGIREVIAEDAGYRVRRITIHPGASLSEHIHRSRNENYSIIKGILSVELDGEEKVLSEKESINIAPGQKHRLFNSGDEDVIAIEVDTGSEIDERDMYYSSQEEELPAMMSLSPAFKDYLWGGHRLVEQFHKDSPYEITAESWELSVHKDGQSVISSGIFAGMSFGDFVAKYGVRACGWKSKTFRDFPILIKFIDALNPLSIQIHPDDDYAFVNENEFGKNEMWYVMDAEPGAFLYCGFSRAVSREEVERRIADHTITEILNKVNVRPGDVFFIPAGTIHAIGAGIFTCEIQQNSNSTYRVYDYDRRDKNGNKRELHIDKALDVMRFDTYEQAAYGLEEPHLEGDTLVQTLGVCKYFQCVKYRVKSEQTLYVDDASFVSLIFLSGTGKVVCSGEMIEAVAGDSIFVPAGRKVLHIEGDCEFIATNI